MLTDPTPYDHAKRLLELVQSDLTDEALAGARGLSALMGGERDAWSHLIDALTIVTEAFARSDLGLPDPQTDTDWIEADVQHGICWVRWRRNKVLVVRKSGSNLRGYYPVVDGHYLSAMGGPPTYPDLCDAMSAAEAAGDA